MIRRLSLKVKAWALALAALACVALAEGFYLPVFRFPFDAVEFSPEGWARADLSWAAQSCERPRMVRDVIRRVRSGALPSERKALRRALAARDDPAWVDVEPCDYFHLGYCDGGTDGEHLRICFSKSGHALKAQPWRSARWYMVSLDW